MNLVSLLASDNYIVVNKDLIKEYGINTALMLGELASEYNYYYKNNLLENDMFFSTIENIEDNTGLSRHQQKKTLDELKSMGIIDVIVKGLPAKRYIKLNIDILTNKFVKNSQTGDIKNDKLESEKVTSNNNNKTITNNSNKERKKKESAYDEIINELVKDNDIKENLYEFIKMRKLMKKPMTDRALKQLIQRLYTLSTDKQEQLKILENSIINGWANVYPLIKDKYRGKKEIVPDWMNKDIETNEATPEEQAELEAKIKALRERLQN